jgi:hypothetical protein
MVSKSGRLIGVIKKLNKYLFLISFFLFIFLLFYKTPLPGGEEVVPDIKNNEPKQTPFSKDKDKKQITTNVGDYEYRLTPLYNYELQGLIVSEYESDNWLDIRHEDDPGNIKDICVVWGENIKNNSFLQLKYKSGEFTCFYRWNKQLEKPFDGEALSNNHLIPINHEVRNEILDSRIGDQIELKGYLVNYEVYKDGKKLFVRDTSTTRNDSGNGACEIIFVTNYKIIKKDKWNLNDYIKPVGLATLSFASLGILLFLFF